MTISSRKPKVEVKPKVPIRGFIHIQLTDEEYLPSPEELERIKKAFEQIRDSLDGFRGWI